MPVKNDRNYRSMELVTIEQREKKLETDFYFEGYATKFDVPYVLFEFEDGEKIYEKIDRHAFDGCDMSDVIFQLNHSGKVYARSSNSTLFLEANDTGLLCYGDLGKSHASQEIHEEIRNGLLTKMSFGFAIAEESYDRATKTRTILKIKKLYDVSVVSIPQNDDTYIQARSFVDGVYQQDRVERRERDLELLKFKLKRSIEHDI